MTVWRLKKGGDRRLRSGHPWVFASELAHSAREVEAGQVVELRDAAGHFLAYGYGHPSSQICFRKLTSHSRETDVMSVDFFRRRFESAYAHRRAAGWTGFSHRWVFAEADALPGLVIDAFKRRAGGWTLVVQPSTAGMDKALPHIYAALEDSGTEKGGLTVVEAPSSQARRLEGLPVGEKRVVFGSARDVYDGEFCFVDDIDLRLDIGHGQKTGFFLDQQWNVRLLKQAFKHRPRRVGEKLNVLDICCYVGQWGAQVAAECMSEGRALNVTLVDVSEPALSFAAHNVSRYAGEVNAICGDALEVLASLPERDYDVVICDPPAFVKKRADFEQGLRAYAKLNRLALGRLKPGGLYVAASCSGLVKAEDWRGVLTQAALKSGHKLRNLFLGGHGPDHPLRPEFPEGEYLKCWVARADT